MPLRGRSTGVDHVLGDIILAGARRRCGTSPARQSLPGRSHGPRGLLLQGHLNRSLGVCQGRVDQRHRAVPGFEEHAEFGASEDDCLRAAVHKICDRSLELVPRCRQKDALGKLSVQGAVLCTFS